MSARRSRCHSTQLETPVQLAGRQVRRPGDIGGRHRAGQVLGDTGQCRLHAAVQRLRAAQPWQPAVQFQRVARQCVQVLLDLCGIGMRRLKEHRAACFWR